MIHVCIWRRKKVRLCTRAGMELIVVSIFVGKCHYINLNLNMHQARECASKVSSDTGMNSEVLHPNNKGTAGSAISETTLGDLMAPLNQVTNKKQ